MATDPGSAFTSGVTSALGILDTMSRLGLRKAQIEGLRAKAERERRAEALRNRLGDRIVDAVTGGDITDAMTAVAEYAARTGDLDSLNTLFDGIVKMRTARFMNGMQQALVLAQQGDWQGASAVASRARRAAGLTTDVTYLPDDKGVRVVYTQLRTNDKGETETQKVAETVMKPSDILSGFVAAFENPDKVADSIETITMLPLAMREKQQDIEAKALKNQYERTTLDDRVRKTEAEARSAEAKADIAEVDAEIARAFGMPMKDLVGEAPFMQPGALGETGEPIEGAARLPNALFLARMIARQNGLSEEDTAALAGLLAGGMGEEGVQLEPPTRPGQAAAMRLPNGRVLDVPMLAKPKLEALLGKRGAIRVGEAPPRRGERTDGVAEPVTPQVPVSALGRTPPMIEGPVPPRGLPRPATALRPPGSGGATGAMPLARDIVPQETPNVDRAEIPIGALRRQVLPDVPGSIGGDVPFPPSPTVVDSYRDMVSKGIMKLDEVPADVLPYLQQGR